MAADRITPQPEFVVIRKSEIEQLISQLDYIHAILDLFLEAQDSRIDALRCIPWDVCDQSGLIARQRVPKKGGGSC